MLSSQQSSNIANWVSFISSNCSNSFQMSSLLCGHDHISFNSRSNLSHLECCTLPLDHLLPRLKLSQLGQVGAGFSILSQFVQELLRHGHILQPEMRNGVYHIIDIR